MSRTKFSLFPRHWGIYPYIWLIYMALFIYNMQFEHGVKKTIGYALLALFVVTYRQLYFVSGRAYDSWVGLQMLLSAILLTFYNPNYIFLGFYTANFISFYRDRRKFNIAYGVLAAYILLPMLFHCEPLMCRSISFHSFSCHHISLSIRHAVDASAPPTGEGAGPGE